MLNKLSAFIHCHDMIRPGDTVVCAVSGGADSVALMLALYQLRDRLKITLQAAHFNHGLRHEESDRDEAFVRQLCDRYGITLHVGRAHVVAGKKGLEAAARDARYAFLRMLPGKIATAHTANDNAETVLMHLIRGTGLKGLGGIAPVSGNVIRPMLTVTREEVLAFLQSRSIPWVEDSSNESDCFLRNRLRRNVMPLLQQENPSVLGNLSHMALRLREDEAFLQSHTPWTIPDVPALREMDPALRSRALSRFLEEHGLAEAQSAYIRLLEQLVFSSNPSASVKLAGGITVRRCYDRLEIGEIPDPLSEQLLPVPGSLDIPGLRIRVSCRQATELVAQKDRFCVHADGPLIVRCRRAGDEMTLSGGSKSLKKLFIDQKLPASLRFQIPVLADDKGIVGVYGFGADQRRIAKEFPCVEIRFEQLSEGLSTQSDS